VSKTAKVMNVISVSQHVARMSTCCTINNTTDTH